MNIIEYLGDGVYAKWDGYGVWLYANHHENPTDKVYIEPSVMTALDRVYKKWAKGEDNADAV